jgi:HEPN domain-containing protein
MKGNPSNPDDWLRIAQRDLASASRNIAAEDVHAGCFFLQQACEKCIKAWLIQNGWELVKTHDFKRLRTEARLLGIDLNPFAEQLDRLGRLYFHDRYVTENEEPDPDLEETRELEKMVKELFTLLFPQQIVNEQ